MNENEFTVTFVAVETDSRYECTKCAFGNMRCYEMPCESEKREDGRNVIFKIKETK